jgi:hypothetical protein
MLHAACPKHSCNMRGRHVPPNADTVPLTLPMGPCGGLSFEILLYSLNLKDRRSCIHSCLKLLAAWTEQQTQRQQPKQVVLLLLTCMPSSSARTMQHASAAAAAPLSVTRTGVLCTAGWATAAHQFECRVWYLPVALLVHAAAVAAEAIVAAHRLQASSRQNNIGTRQEGAHHGQGWQQDSTTLQLTSTRFPWRSSNTRQLPSSSSVLQASSSASFPGSGLLRVGVGLRRAVAGGACDLRSMQVCAVWKR